MCCLIDDNRRLQYLIFCLFEIYVSVFFVIRCLYSAVNITLVREQRFIRIIYNFYLFKVGVTYVEYWAVQAGLLTPLTFAWHRLSPLAAFTSDAYFLHNGRQ